MSIPVIAKQYLRVLSFLDHIDDEYTYELDNIFYMLGQDILKQYAKETDAEVLFGILSDMVQGTNIYVDGRNVAMIQEASQKTTLVEVSLPYSQVLKLEWAADDMANQIDNCNLRVEDMLSISFYGFVKKLTAGELPGIGKVIQKYTKELENSIA